MQAEVSVGFLIAWAIVFILVSGVTAGQALLSGKAIDCTLLPEELLAGALMDSGQAVMTFLAGQLHCLRYEVGQVAV
jgi:hypothetical protein